MWNLRGLDNYNGLDNFFNLVDFLEVNLFYCYIMGL